MVVEHAHGLRQRRGPNAKSSLHKAHLAPDAGLQAPGASLSFAQGSHDFESLDRGIGRGDRFETAHRLDQYLELSVIGLDHVIEILHLPVGRLPVQLSFALQFGDRCTIARRFVGIERGRLFPVLQASQGLAQEPLRCLGAAGRRQVEIDRVAPLVDCPVQVGPLAPHLDVGFIQAPARIKATPPEPAQPLLHLRGVALDPAIDRRMVDRNAAFRQHFLKVAIADRIATIPAHRPQDHITLEMAPLEIRHRSVRPISAKHAQASRFLQQSLIADTFSSLVWKVSLPDGTPAIVKGLKPIEDIADELRGADYLVWRNGRGAVRLLGRENNLMLLEYAGERMLSHIVAEHGDYQATEIAAELMAKLYAASEEPLPSALLPIRDRFAALFQRARDDQNAGCQTDYVHAAIIADQMMSNASELRGLHGDLHHENIMFSSRGWLVIDPVGLVGEVGFGAANMFYDPADRDDLCLDPRRIAQMADAFSRALDVDPRRLLDQAYAYGCLSAAWNADGEEEQRDLAIAAAIKQVRQTSY